MKMSVAGMLTLLILQFLAAGAVGLDASALTSGVTSICPWGFGDQGNAGVPGPIEVTGPSAIPIMTGDDDTNPKNAIVVVASESGNGRVVALGHDGFFIDGTALNLLDNRKFGYNIVDWLHGTQDSSKKRIIVTTGHGEPWVGSGQYEQFFGELAGRGYTIVKSPGTITSEMLLGAGILLISCPGPSLTDSEISQITSFVSNGGGLFIQGLGWAWLAYEKKPLEEAPMNKIGANYGFKWVGGYISDPTDNHNGCPIFHVLAPLSDISISQNDIAFSNSNPKVGESTAITASIHNIGEVAANNVVVKFFDGDPANGGTQIGNDVIIESIDAGETDLAQVSWNPTGGSVIFVVVANEEDKNPNNNKALKEIDVIIVDTGFRPSVNGFNFNNFIMPWPISNCLGMSEVAQYYFINNFGLPDSDTCNPEKTANCESGPIPGYHYYLKSMPPKQAIAMSIISCPILPLIIGFQNAEIWGVPAEILDWAQYLGTNKETQYYEQYIYLKDALNNEPTIVLLGYLFEDPIISPDIRDLLKHSVLAYKIEELSDKTKRIYVYNPNSAGNDRAYFDLIPTGLNSLRMVECTHLGCASDDYNTFFCHADLSKAMENYIKGSIENLQHPPLIVLALSPIYLEVVDPDGQVINRVTNQIEGSGYLEGDIDEDDSTDGLVMILNPKSGIYRINVVPKPNVQPTETYTLIVSSNSIPEIIADKISINDIPDTPYTVEIKPNYAEEVAKEAALSINEYIQRLPSSAFDEPKIADKRKKALFNKFVAIEKQIQNYEYEEAIDKLQTDIRAKADATVEGDPNDDWITDAEAQKEICKMIDDLIAYLETLKSEGITSSQPSDKTVEDTIHASRERIQDLKLNAQKRQVLATQHRSASQSESGICASCDAK